MQIGTNKRNDDRNLGVKPTRRTSSELGTIVVKLGIMNEVLLKRSRECST